MAVGVTNIKARFAGIVACMRPSKWYCRWFIHRCDVELFSILLKYF